MEKYKDHAAALRGPPSSFLYCWFLSFTPGATLSMSPLLSCRLETLLNGYELSHVCCSLFLLDMLVQCFTIYQTGL
jgi:hypothetical protein